MNPLSLPRRLFAATEIFARDAGRGLLLVSHNGLALVGLLALAAAVVVVGPAGLRSKVEQQVYSWLHLRHGSTASVATVLDGMSVGAVSTTPTREPAPSADDVPPLARAIATDPSELTKPQAAVATWISRRYKVAPEPIGRLVQEAWEAGREYGVEPTLILAIMAVESSFNPFAQSSVGAQGLMQVMTKIHDKKYQPFGGAHAAFDPVTNLRVGVEVLKECIARAGGVYDGLRHYVGAANLASDGGYAGKVLGEHQNLKKIAAGVAVPHTVRIVPMPAPAKPQEATAPDAPTTTAPAQVALAADAP